MSSKALAISRLLVGNFASILPTNVSAKLVNLAAIPVGLDDSMVVFNRSALECNTSLRIKLESSILAYMSLIGCIAAGSSFVLCPPNSGIAKSNLTGIVLPSGSGTTASVPCSFSMNPDLGPLAIPPDALPSRESNHCLIASIPANPAAPIVDPDNAPDAAPPSPPIIMPSGPPMIPAKTPLTAPAIAPVIAPVVAPVAASSTILVAESLPGISFSPFAIAVTSCRIFSKVASISVSILAVMAAYMPKNGSISPCSLTAISWAAIVALLKFLLKSSVVSF